MKRDPTSQRIRRGSAIMAGLVLTAVLVFNVDVILDWFRSYVEVVAVVRETSGVYIGSDVWIEGVNAGRVTDIGFMELGGRPAVAFHVRLEDRARQVVRADSRVHAVRQRLIGVPTLLISAGSAGSPPVANGDTLYPADRPSVEMLLERGKAFAPAVESLTAALVELEGMVSERQPRVERLIDHMAVASDEAATLRAALDRGSLGHWLEDPTMGQRIEQLNRRVAALSEAADGIERYGAPELQGSVESVATRARELGAALDELERSLSTGRGVLGRMERDTAIQVAIEGVQAQIDSLRAAGLGFFLRMFLP